MLKVPDDRRQIANGEDLGLLVETDPEVILDFEGKSQSLERVELEIFNQPHLRPQLALPSKVVPGDLGDTVEDL